MNPDQINSLYRAMSDLRRTIPESIGTPRINGFNLDILPPWPDCREDEVLSIRLTSVAVCCLTLGGGVLMSHMVGENDRWDLPGGHVEKIDLSPAVAACREFREETGLELNPGSIEPFSYGWRQREGENIGGLQYLASLQIEIPAESYTDQDGRVFMSPFLGADVSEVDQLVVEPLGIFLDRKKSILNSPHSWAYRRTFGSLRDRLIR